MVMNAKDYLKPEVSVADFLGSVPVLAASYGAGTPGVFHDDTDIDNYGEF